MFLLRCICYIFIAHMSFLILFPYTGLGRIIYLSISLVVWVVLSIVTNEFLKKTVNLKKKKISEIIFVLAMLIILVFTFVQDSNVSPFKQLIQGKVPTMQTMEDGINSLF